MLVHVPHPRIGQVGMIQDEGSPDTAATHCSCGDNRHAIPGRRWAIRPTNRPAPRPAWRNSAENRPCDTTRAGSRDRPIRRRWPTSIAPTPPRGAPPAPDGSAAAVSRARRMASSRTFFRVSHEVTSETAFCSAGGRDRQGVFHPAVIQVARHFHVQPLHSVVHALLGRGQFRGLDFLQENLLVGLDQKHVAVRQHAHRRSGRTGALQLRHGPAQVEPGGLDARRPTCRRRWRVPPRHPSRVIWRIRFCARAPVFDCT